MKKQSESVLIIEEILNTILQYSLYFSIMKLHFMKTDSANLSRINVMSVDFIVSELSKSIQKRHSELFMLVKNISSNYALTI